MVSSDPSVQAPLEAQMPFWLVGVLVKTRAIAGKTRLYLESVNYGTHLNRRNCEGTYCASRSCRLWLNAYDSRYSATAVPFMDSIDDTSFEPPFWAFASPSTNQQIWSKLKVDGITYSSCTPPAVKVHPTKQTQEVNQSES